MGSERVRKQWLLGLVLLAVIAGFVGMSGCAKSTNPLINEEARLGGDKLVQAQKLYAQLKRDHSLHRDRSCLELAGNLLDYYAGFERNDEVLSLAVLSAQRLGDSRQALALTDEFLTKFPLSPLVDQRLVRGGEIALAAGDTLAASAYLIQHYNRGPERATQSDGLPSAAPIWQSLSVDEISGFRETQSGQPVWSYLSYLQVEKLLSAGDYRRAETVGDQMVILGEGNHWLAMARELLQGGSATHPVFARPSGPVNVNRIGVLSPLTGRFAVLGNAFVDACLMALDQANRETGREFELLVEDTAGNPVNSALVSRRLCGEEGCMSLFGALMSDPTATAALVADQYGVPLVSPTATNDRVWQLGDKIFQTNLTGFYEVRLLAQLATTVMLKERFAIIHPDDPEGRRNAEVFAAEIEALGGKIVAVTSFPPQGTDFRDPIQEMKKRRPEVVFAPATVDQMVLLGPQLDFYRMGSLTLGLSNWNSQKLITRAGNQLERAIFPSDQALIPPHWTAEFKARWDGSHYPQEASAIALRAYQSMRMLLDTMATSGAANRPQLAEALTKRLANRNFEGEGPGSFENVVRMFRTQRITPFTADIFSEAWELTEGARLPLEETEMGMETGPENEARSLLNGAQLSPDRQ